MRGTVSPLRGALLLLTLLSTTLVGIAPDVGADHGGDHPPFECDGNALLTQGGKLYNVLPDPANPGTYLFDQIGGTGIANSLGYNPLDNYLYGVQGANIIKYDATGAVMATIPLGAPFPGPTGYTGTFLGDGTYIIGTWRGTYNGTTRHLWAVDPNTGAVTHVSALNNVQADWAYNPLDGYIYHSTGGVSWQIDPLTGAEVNVGTLAGIPSGFGSSWFDSAGNWYGLKNSTGELYQITDIASPNAAWSVVGQTPGTGGGDGASCVSEWDVKKDVAEPDRSFRPGEIVTYEITIFNNGLPTKNVPVDVCDTLPAPLVLTGTFSDSTGSGSLISGGAAGDSSYCYRVEVDSSLWTDPATPGAPPTVLTFDVQTPANAAPGTYENQADVTSVDPLLGISLVSDDPDDVAAENDPTPIDVTGQITVDKEVLGHPVDPTTDAFTVTISCTVAGVAIDVDSTSIVAAGTTTPWPAAGVNTFSIRHGEKIDILDLPPGAICEIGENADPQYTATTTSSDPSKTSTSTIAVDEAAGAEQVSITNSTGELTIRKRSTEASQHPVDPSGTFEFRVECDNGFDQTFSLTNTVASAAAAEGTLVHPDLPLFPDGAVCFVNELGPPAGWVLGSGQNLRATILNERPYPITFINRRELASLTITKEIPALPDGADLSNELFTVDVSCSGGFLVDPYVISDVQISVNTPATITNLPVGAVCSVTEDPDPRFTTSYTPASAEIDADGAALTVVNSTAALELIKIATVVSDHPIDTEATFSFSIVCDNGYSGVHTVTTSNATATGATGSIGYNALPLLPPNTSCTVTEQTPPAGWTIASANPQTVVLNDADGTSTIEFVNVPELVDLAITKDVVGLDGDLDGTTFTVDISCTGGFDPDPYVLLDVPLTTTAPILIENLPSTATCTITEDSDPRFTPSVTPAVVSLDGGSDTVEVAITNSTGSLTIHKETTVPAGHPVDPTGVFTFDVVCSNGYTGTHVVTVATATATGAEGDLASGAIPPLAAGTTCTVTEQTPASPWSIAGANPVKISVPAGDEPTVVEFTNSMDRADLTVTKIVEGPTALAGTIFLVDISCTGPFSPSPYLIAAQSLSATTPLVIEDLPVGSTCTVVEAADPRFAATYTPTDGSAVVTPTGGAVAVTNRAGTFGLTKTVAAESTLPLASSATFTFAVACTNGYSGTHTITVDLATGSSSATTPALPAVASGSTCTATEQTPPAGWANVDPLSQTVSISPTETPDLTFTNRREVGSLSIGKQIIGTPAGTDLSTQEFLVDLSCTGDFAPSPYVVADVVVSVNVPATIDGLPTGATCTVVEQVDPGFAATNPAPRTIAAGPNEVAVVNRTGTLSITKALTAPATVTDGATFTFDVACDNGFSDTVSVTATTTADGSLGHPDLPLMAAGTVCTITERTPPTGWSVQAPNPKTVTISTDGDVRAAFVNTRDTATLEISKSLLGVPDDQNFDDYEFGLSVTCSGPFPGGTYMVPGPLTFSVSDPLLVTDLPAGADCTVVETPDSGWTPTADSGESNVVLEPGANSFGLTNAGGQVIVAKESTVVGPHPIDPEATFTFDIDCTNGYGETHQLTTTATTATQASGTITYNDLPPIAAGSQCTVEELAPPPGWSLATANPVTVDIDPDDPATASFTNTRDIGTLTVTKTIVGTPADEDLGDELFVVDVTCAGEFSVSPYVMADLEVSVNTPLVIDNLPTGAVCTVVEDAGDWFATSYSPATATITADGSAAVAIVNTTGTFDITKAVTAPAIVEDGDTFTFAVVCDNGFTDTVTVAASTAATGTITRPTMPLLPAGTTCQVTETAVPSNWTAASTAPVEIVITGDGTVPTAGFSNDRKTSELVVTKALAGVPAGTDLDDEPFEVAIVCTGDFPGGTYTVPGPLAISVNAPVTVPDLPLGAVCTITETADDRFRTVTDPASGEITVTVDTAQVQIDNRTGVMSISKTAQVNDATNPADTFTFSIVCDNGYSETVTVDVTADTSLSGSGSIGYDRLPLLADGTMCTITELPGAGWTPVSPTSAIVDIETGAPSEASFVNTRDTSSLTVTKTVLGLPAGEDLGDEPFTVDIECTGGTNPDPLALTGQTVTVNTPLVVTGIPTSAVCTVAERADPRFLATTDPVDGQVTIDGDGETVAITNTTGSFAISKSLAFESTHPIEDGDSFTFDVVCDNGYSGTVVATATLNLGGLVGRPALPLLAAGTTCTITETAVPAGWSLVGDAAVEIVIPADGSTPTAAFTNERDTSNLMIAKSLQGIPVGADFDDVVFSVDVVCSGDFAGGAYTVPGPLLISVMTPLLIEDLPTGAVCTVTETSDPRFTAVPDPLGGEITITIDTAEVLIDNRAGELRVVKTTEVGAAVDPFETFSFTIECDNGYTEAIDVEVDVATAGGATGSLGYDSLPLLPAGTTCSIAELPKTGWTPTGPTTVDLIIDPTAPAAGSFINRRDTATLTVTKTIEGMPADESLADEPFIVDVICRGGTEPDPLELTGLTVTANAPLAIDGIPTGAVCEVTEEPDVRFATTYAPDDGTVTIADDGAVVAIINTTGTFAISKTVTAPATHPIESGDVFTFTASCDNGYTSTMSVEATLGQAGLIGRPALPLLPAGTTCTVSEIDVPIGWTPGATDPVIVVIPGDGTIPTAAFVNNRDVTELTITKTISGLPDGENPDDLVFEITVSCTGDFVGGAYDVPGPLTLSTATPVVIPNLPSDASCVVSEVFDDRFDAIPDASGGLFVLESGTTNLTIDNRTGQFAIEKYTDTGALVDPTDVFTFEVVCDNGYSSTIDVEVTPATDDGGGGGFGSVGFPALPLVADGTTCEITETAPEGWTITSEPTVSLFVNPDATATAVFGNSRDTASLTVAKVLVGVPADEDLTGEIFLIDVTCTGGTIPDPLEIAGQQVSVDQPFVLDGLPTGAVCTVVESADDRFTTTYEPASGVVTIDAEGALVTISNATGSLAITKTVEAPETHNVEAAGVFTFEIGCDNGYTATALIDASTGTPGTISRPELPLLPSGTSCTVSETDIPSGWAAASTDAVAVVIGATAEPVVELSFLNTRTTGSLTLSKTIEGLPGGATAPTPFLLDVSCDGDFADTPLTLTAIELTPGTPTTIDDLPTGAACTVTEHDDPRFTVVMTPADGLAVIDDGTAAVDLVNLTGTLQIHKLLTALVDDINPPEGEFVFELSCDNGYADSHTLTATAIDEVTGEGHLDLGPELLFGAGTRCDITEEQSLEWVTVGSPTQAVVVTTGPTTVTFSNIRSDAYVSGTLAFTGSESRQLAMLAFLLLALGALLALIPQMSRRRF